jgi:hypothetical protein
VRVEHPLPVPIAPAGSADPYHASEDPTSSCPRPGVTADFSQAGGRVNRAQRIRIRSGLDLASMRGCRLFRAVAGLRRDATRGTPLAFLVEAASVVKPVTLIRSTS